MLKTCCYLLFLVVATKLCIAQPAAPAIDVLHYNFAIRLNDENNTIKGVATIQLKFLRDVNVFSLNLVKQNDAGKGMRIASITETGKTLIFEQDSDAVNIKVKAPANSIHAYKITYYGVPADGLIISTNAFGHRTFFGDNWPNRAHNWLPCADYPADKATVDFEVTAPAHYQVVANGLKVEEKLLPGDFKFTHWKERVALPTKVMVIGVADFAISHTGNVGNIPVYTYVFPEDKDAGFKSYTVAKEILPFYIKNVGPYAYEKLANVQSKTIFGGMENASAIFYFEQSVNSKGIEELMAHEIAHQWFGDAASEKNFGHLWLSEGFATYMTNLYLENKYGADTLEKRMAADRQTVLRFEKRRLTPVVDTAVKSNYMQLLNANSYQKGSWVLHMLRQKLGDVIFWKAVSTYYSKFNGSNANTDDLRQVMEQVSGQNLQQFFNQWLYTAGHPKLALTWRYDQDKKVIQLQIKQEQDTPYQLAVQFGINGQVYTFNVNEKDTTIQMPALTKPDHIMVDPNTNLLADFNLTENK